MSETCLQKPTQLVARFVERQVTVSEEATKTGRQEIRYLLDEPVIGNGVRGNALRIIALYDELTKLHQQLRASAHKDLGPVEEEP